MTHTYKVETKPSLWHVMLSKGCYSDYKEENYFFAGNDENEIWIFLCRYMNENHTEKTRYYCFDCKCMKWNDKNFVTDNFTGDKEDINWSNDYDTWNVEIKRLDVIYFKE